MRQNKFIFVTGVLFLLPFLLAQGACNYARAADSDKRSINAVFLEAPQNFDGKLDDAVWEKAQVARDFYNMEGTQLVNVQTEVRVIAASDGLWFGVIAFEPYMDRIRATQQKDGDRIWEDDSVELFFAYPNDTYDLRQFVVNSNGLRYMGYGKGTSVRPADYPNWMVEASKGSKEWTAEIFIPYHVLGLEGAPEQGENISFNIARSRYVEGREYSSWAILYEPDFHRKEKYGVIFFGGSAVETEQAATEPLQKQVTTQNDIGPTYLVNTTSSTALFTVPIPAPDENAKTIDLFASINEYESLPIIISNLTDTTEAYRVIIFSEEVKGIEQRGLKGQGGNTFAGDAITIREAVRTKDSDKTGYGIRFDALPCINDGYTITVPAGDTGLVWVTFDCSDAIPGDYTGFLRVIPLNQPAEYRTTYSGPMVDIPLYLKVWPIELSEEPPIPLCLYRKADNEKFFTDKFEHGVRYYQVNSWALTMKFNADGTIKEPVNMPIFHQYIQENLSWFPEGSDAKMWIGYSLYDVFEQEHAKGQFSIGSDAWRTAWISFLQEMDYILKEEYGLTYDDYVVEMFDEPALNNAQVFERVRMACQVAKEAVPDMKIQLTLSYLSPISTYESLAPYVDSWCFYYARWNDPEQVAYFKELQERGKEIWFYICDISMRGSLYRYYRLHAWKAFAWKLDGMAMWEYIGGPGGYYGADSWKRAAAGPLAYRSFDEPIPSIRYECLREGLDDIKYLAKLRSLVEMAKKQGLNNTEVGKAEQLLNNEPIKVVEQAWDDTYAERIRQSAAEYIMQLQDLLAH